jgi:hypothetical protein
LYNATSSDAHTFERAIADPEVRREVERVFKRKLSDKQLEGMALQAKAEADYWSRYLQGLERVGEAERRIPGQPPPPQAVEPIENPAAILPPQAVSPSVSVAIPDRWRILDALGRPENVFDPYNTNTLKADKPIFGEDWFFNFGAISDTLYEPSRVPTPVSAIAAARPGSNNTFGRYGQSFFSQQEIVTLSLIEGNTAFKPPDFELTFVYSTRIQTAGSTISERCSGKTTSSSPTFIDKISPFLVSPLRLLTSLTSTTRLTQFITTRTGSW